MSAEDLAKGIAALDDDEVRARVAGGDLAAAGDLELTAEEQDLLRAAASDEAEVVGHGLTSSLAGLGSLNSKLGAGDGVTVNRAKTADKAFKAMDGYIRG